MSKQLKGTVISFRVPQQIKASLDKQLKAEAVFGINSANKLARKYLLDTISGKLEYKNPEDRKDNPDCPALR